MALRLVRSTVVLFVVALVALVAMPARGQGKHKEQKLVEQGRRAYNLGHWSDALADFEKAYESSGDSALLFNLAETHRQLGHTADACASTTRTCASCPNGPEHEAAATEIKSLNGTAAAKSPPAVTPPPPATALPPAPRPRPARFDRAGQAAPPPRGQAARRPTPRRWRRRPPSRRPRRPPRPRRRLTTTSPPPDGDAPRLASPAPPPAARRSPAPVAPIGTAPTGATLPPARRAAGPGPPRS